MSHEIEHRKATTPEDKSAHDIREQFNEKENPRSAKWGRGKQVGVAATILTALAVGGGLTMKSLSGEANEAPEPGTQPTVEAPVVPGEPAETEAPAPVETEPAAVIELEPIAADAPAEVLAQRTNELFLEWIYSGASEDTVEDAYNAWQETSGISVDDFTFDLAQKNADRYASVLFPSTWTEDPTLNQYYNDYTGKNAEMIGVALQRYVTGEPLIETTVSISDVVEFDAPEGQRIVNYNIDGETLNSENEYLDQNVALTFDISDGTARLIATQVLG